MITQNRGRVVGSEAGRNGGRERVGIRLSSADRERAAYWADKRGYPSINEYMATAVIEKIRRENGDFDIPDLLTARMNQLIDVNKALSTNVANLERVITSGLDSLIGLTRGENYLLDEYEDGEL